ncbi:MAG: hypothetical protein FVQ85_19430 [Planctomycetes bacterium]|nr:hypothetical protein [Planctomycetota bacterium]
MKAKCLVAVLVLSQLFITANKSYACHLSPVADLVVIPQYTDVGRSITFDGSASYDPDGPTGIGGGLIEGIKRFEWDFDYKESEGFTLDYYETTSHHDGAFDGVTTYPPYYTAGTYKVMLKVTDNDAAEGGTSDKSDTTICEVIIYVPDIVFTLEDISEGQVRISYTTNHGALPRSIALGVTLDSGYIYNETNIVTKAPEYNGFMDYAHSNPNPGYQLGTGGHPLAAPDAPGVPNFGIGIDAFSINMACFDENGNQAFGPASANPLIDLQLHGSGSSTLVTISEDTLRSSFADSGLTTNLPQTATIVLPAPPPPPPPP